MKIRRLFQNIPDITIKGSKECEVLGICSNSKKAFPGCLFIAKKGKNFDGSAFVQEALQAGAAAIVSDLYDPFLENIVQIIVKDPSLIEADIAAEFYGYPSKHLIMIGVTGTKGKTTTAYLIRHILEKSSFPCGLIGTIESIIQEKRISSSHTTPDPVSLQKTLKEMVDAGCKACVMEVSSHGLDQNRVKHIFFDIAVLTNFTSDHLDYHGCLENYLEAKQKLFSSLVSKKSPVAIINLDSREAEKFQAATPCPVISYSIDKESQIKATNIRLSLEGTAFTLEAENQTREIFVPLMGCFNIYNILAAIAATRSAGISFLQIEEALKTFEGVPGRMEKVPLNQPVHIYVDFAHTEDSLKNILLTLQQLKKKRLITIFGCGGNRDRTKRPKMGKVAEEYSDLVIVTSDNCRNEKPEEIIQEILAGFQKSDYLVEIDRATAIKKAMEIAQEDDIILIAGKGHEKIQIVGNRQFAFDDKEVASDMAKKYALQTE